MSAGVLAPAGSPSALCVLLVEDSVDDELLLRRHLTRAGREPSITRVESAEEMRRELHNSSTASWDVILADYNLPRFSAPEALQVLKSTGLDIPFIVMSGAVNEETAVASMRAGAHDYVSKDNLARLLPAIEREMAEARSRRSKRAAEQALEASEERFHRLVEATPLPLLLADHRGELVYWNRAAERLLGFPESADGTAEAATLDRVLLPEAGEEEDEPWSPQGALRALAAVSKEHAGETVERACAGRTGRRIPVLLGASLLSPEAPAEKQQIAAFLVDLSEQKRAEEIMRRTEKLAAAGRLAASIAHEINNPLEAVTNCMYLLSQLPLPENARYFVDLAQGELDRVTHITTQTLRFYRQTSRSGPTPLAELFETVLTLYEGRLRSQSIQVTRDFTAVPPINAFAGEIRQVLANLFGNALDALIASENQTKTLVLRIRPSRLWQTGEKAVSVVVADTGVGMPPATLRRIYEPFFSTKGATGTGLGLWVTVEIVAKHHGRLVVRSRHTGSTGTVFRLVLPVDGTPEPAGSEQENTPSA